MSEDLAQESELRQSLLNEKTSSKPRRTTRLKLTLRTPTQETGKQQQQKIIRWLRQCEAASIEKIKVTSPTKSPRTKLFDAKTSNGSIVKQEKDKHHEEEEEEVKRRFLFCLWYARNIHLL